MSADAGARGRGVRLLGRGLGLVLLVGLWLTIDFARVPALLRGADPWCLLLAAPCFLASTLVKAVRWRLILRGLDVDYPLGRCLSVYQAGAFLGFVTPGRVGDLARTAWLHEERGTPLAVGVASVLADRLLDLALLGAAAGLAGWVAAPPGPLRAATLALLGLLAVGILVLATPGVARALLDAGTRLPGAGRIVAPVRRALAELWRPLSRLALGELVVPALLTAVQWALLFVGGFALIRALGIPLGLGEAVWCISLSTAVSLVPVSVSGIGTRDAALVALFSTRGIGAPEALTFALLYLVWSLVFSNGIGAWLWFRNPPELRRATA